jgi:acetylornithine deacetylase/succinyl-diaminopimelate desuccinylase-like protein
MLDIAANRRFIESAWDDSIVPQLVEYVRIPAKSPAFDPDWATHGYMDDAVSMMARWCREQPLRGAEVEVVRLPGRTPVIVVEVPGEAEGCVLLYGHLDKQPEMTGWRDGLGPWTPVIEEGKLYGRGGADDGYAVYASLTALASLQAQGVPHPRCVVLIEACEESGSYDLPRYLETLAARIGTPDLVVCLDAGCGNYEQLWITTSLRGIVAGTLTVDVLTEGVHSGDAGGIVPSSFRIARALLDRLEDAASGRILPAFLSVEIPPQRREQAGRAAMVLGATVHERFPFVEGAGPTSADGRELVLARTWRPALEVTGAHGLPPVESAGNVARPGTGLKLSVRVPPTCDADTATSALRELLEADPPSGARVRFETDHAAGGWNAPAVAPWLDRAVQAASQAHFGREAVYMGEGGTIPFMGMLGEAYPRAQFLITGVLGPKSNAHGPNEFLHIETGKRLTCCVADVIARMPLR